MVMVMVMVMPMMMVMMVAMMMPVLMKMMMMMMMMMMVMMMMMMRMLRPMVMMMMMMMVMVMTMIYEDDNDDDDDDDDVDVGDDGDDWLVDWLVDWLLIMRMMLLMMMMMMLVMMMMMIIIIIIMVVVILLRMMMPWGRSQPVITMIIKSGYMVDPVNLGLVSAAVVATMLLLMGLQAQFSCAICILSAWPGFHVPDGAVVRPKAIPQVTLPIEPVSRPRVVDAEEQELGREEPDCPPPGWVGRSKSAAAPAKKLRVKVLGNLRASQPDRSCIAAPVGPRS
ncbi:hypothetical protein AK812_SmicGene21429 [Symbiodinium microadriaticum]|uniref:Uncharacterized protein n=1 Tax=Symbiodinium microadriaticum TaxID=2951 RepID=A0A1Q9DMF3_SYMMI|nr:hypothetical protein AK812_SmicGene21429 [Symbiodinium microadriaticum]